MDEFLEHWGGEDPFAARTELQSTMQRDVGIFRDEDGLDDAMRRLDQLDLLARNLSAQSLTRAYNPGWHLCRDIRNMLIVARAVTSSALQRKESRGAHSRLDYPGYDDYWREHNVVVRDEGGTMVTEHVPVQRSAELAELVQQRQAIEKMG
jgi:succinate dehydrogenase / fumarate reductase, flavoprotein subunit